MYPDKFTQIQNYKCFHISKIIRIEIQPEKYM